MQALQDEVETIHLYVVREEAKRSYTAFPLLCAFLCLVGMAAITLYSAEHPYYEHQRLTVLAELLPLKTFTAQAPIVPTGIKTYPATVARGVLTITNGSIISQTLPAGLTLLSDSGVQVATDQAVFVPAGSADGYGMATVSAHLLTLGINMSTLSINQTLGTSLYIRNLSPFTGGRPAYAVKYATAQDKHAALLRARGILLSKSSGLHYPCKEERFLLASVKMTWRCQFVSYRLPAYMHVTAAHLSGRNVLVDAIFIPRPQRMWTK